MTVITDHNKVEFGFDEPVGNYQYFSTEWQNMEWDEEEKLLSISNMNPKYSFRVFFPEQ
ncbi:hypothetical protein [Kosakonia sacchari]